MWILLVLYLFQTKCGAVYKLHGSFILNDIVLDRFCAKVVVFLKFIIQKEEGFN